MGNNRIFLPICHSTNSFAAALLEKESVSEGTIVITKNQCRGRGQRGNSWEAEPNKNLTLSIILFPAFVEPRYSYQLYVLATVSIHQVLSGMGVKNVRIKWPNDILVSNKKICGILIENSIHHRRIEHSIFGIGLNVNQTDFVTDGAISVKTLKGEEIDLDSLLDNLLSVFEKNYLLLKAGKSQELLGYYHHHLYWKGEMQYFRSDSDFPGIIEGIDEYGRLLIRSTGKVQHYNHKEVIFLN